LTRERCDVLVRVPMHGNVASLNVSAAATLACHEVARRRATERRAE
jgi:23S rRNA (guanosine2251-2'-O)-methyltransferase